jgi:DNA-binding beta-propeller fold protein YncE
MARRRWHVALLATSILLVAGRGGAGTLPFEVQGLFGSTDRLAITPDGTRAYARGTDVVVSYVRDLATGELVFTGSPRDGFDGIDGLEGDGRVAVSPDGLHVYATSMDEDSVAAFASDAVTGELTLVDLERDGAGGVDGLDGAVALTVSPDGAQVYVVARFDHAVTVFARDTITGALTFVETLKDGNGGVDGLNGAWGVAVSGDGAHVYVVSGPDSSADDAVAVFARDAGTGMLTFVQAVFDETAGVTTLDGVRDVLVSGDGTNVYTASPEGIAVFARNASLGTLALVQEVYEAAFTLDQSPDGSALYVGLAGFSPFEEVSVWSRAPGTGTLTFLQFELGGRIGVRVSPDGLYVYADRQIYARDLLTNEITLVGTSPPGAPGNGIALSPDGAHFYTTGLGQLLAWTRDAVTGKLTFADGERDGSGGVDGLAGASDLAVSPDGLHLYVAARGDDAVAVFARNTGTGAVTFVEVERDGVGGADGLDGALQVAVSADGANVYVTAPDEDAVAVFARNAGTGALTFVEAERDGVGGTEGLARASYLVVSPDGANVYVGTDRPTTLNDLTIFARDAGTGALTYLERVVVRGGVSALAISPDGGDLYVATHASAAGILVFSRDPTTGGLTPTQELHDDAGGLHSINGPSDVAVSADGLTVVVAAAGGLTTFSRMPATGELVYRHALFSGFFGAIPTLMQPTAVSIAPDARHVYASSGLNVSAKLHVIGFAPLCPAVPAAGCRSAGTSSLSLKDKPGTVRDRVRFGWLNGDATPVAALGEPQLDPTSYALCLYENGNLIADLNAPHGAFCLAESGDTDLPADTCWQPIGPSSLPRGLRYRRPFGAPDGLTGMRLLAGGAGHARITGAGAGSELSLPALPLAPPVTMQIMHTDGECWSSTFASSDVQVNDPVTGTFRARH